MIYPNVRYCSYGLPQEQFNFSFIIAFRRVEFIKIIVEVLLFYLVICEHYSALSN